MAKTNSAKNTRNLNQKLTSLGKLVRTGFRQTGTSFRRIDKRFGQVDHRLGRLDRRLEVVQVDHRNLRKEMNERFEEVNDRIDRLATHIDGFMKLHETLDIELRVMKEQMKRFEERLGRIEAAQTS